MNPPAADGRPDVILLLTDEERAPVPWEDEALTRWRHETLAGRRWFDDHGVVLQRHYTGSVACVPSRPTLFTGQYPDVHGVTQTDGIGKEADDVRMRWLRPGEVPTMGHWFRALGYDTHYDGKWHITHADLTDPDTGERIATNTVEGAVLADGVAAYLDADPLDAFGFSGWVGPEPHGANLADCGLVRDPLIAARVSAWLADRYARRLAGDPAALRPFLCVASFVNPHDIVLFPAWLRLGADAPTATDPWGTPTIPPPPTIDEDLSTKPAVQTRYRDTYPTAYGPVEIVGAMYTDHAAEYRHLYHRLHADVDGPLDAVRRAVCDGAGAGAAPGGTVLVRSADHGDLLGSHGGLHQKWFTLYDEAVRVPCAVVHLDAAGAPTTTGAPAVDAPTSHVDLLPTLLGAAGADVAALADELAATHTEVHPLPGSDLWADLVVGTVDPRRSAYLQTRDNVLEGDLPDGLAARHNDFVDPPPEFQIAVPTSAASNVEAVVVRVVDDEVAGAAGHLFKCVRTFDDPAGWTEPHVRQLATSGPDGVHWRTEVLDDEWELYDLDDDPTESRNLASDPTASAALELLRGRLNDERRARVAGRHAPWPYATGGAVAWVTAGDAP